VLLYDLDQVDLGLDLGEGVIGRWGGHCVYCRAGRVPGCSLDSWFKPIAPAKSPIASNVETEKAQQKLRKS
jgi:hypothetical protein